MAIYELYKHPQYFIYKSSFWSKASAFKIITTLVTFIAPLLIAYRSQGFWKKEDSYREQPDVHYKHEIILMIQTQKDFVGWSSFSSYNQLLQKHLRVPMIKSHQKDVNYDGKLDSITFTIEFPIKNDENITGISLLLLFDYKLYRYSFLQMESFVYVQHSSSIAGSSLSVVGDLKIVQKQNLGHKGRDNRFNSSVINKISNFAEDFNLYKILSDYSERNVSTRLENIYTVWNPSYGKAERFKLNLKIQVPEETIKYSLGFWQLMKWAWIQYVSILLIFLWIFDRIEDFVFRNQILPTLTNILQSKFR
ncbi:TMEM231 (predicted) [Pycnogonum litorale]